MLSHSIPYVKLYFKCIIHLNLHITIINFHNPVPSIDTGLCFFIGHSKIRFLHINTEVFLGFFEIYKLI